MPVTLQWSAAEDDYIQRHYATDTDCEIAHHLGRKVEAVCKRRAHLGFLRSRLPKDTAPHKRASDPTPEEISRECARIRARWTENDLRMRATWAHANIVETTVYRVNARANGQIVIGRPSNAS